MKKSLVIVSGEIGKHFLTRLTSLEISQNEFHVVTYGDFELPAVLKENYAFYKFDPTSMSKLSPLLDEEYMQVLIVMEDKDETLATIRNIRFVKPKMRIAVVNLWGIKIEEPGVVVVNSHEILADRVLNYLPDVPILAQNIGLGGGEIIEVLVPFGSSYVYRHVSSIRQKNWRISAIYRNNDLMLPSANSMIQPNDRLVIIGEPPVLKSVFKAIKRQLGQFPAPYGKNLYLFIDMKRKTAIEIRKMVKKALFLHQKFSGRIFIRIINPNDLKALEEIKFYDSDDINVIVDYNLNNTPELIENDVDAFNVGLIILDAQTFRNKEYRKALYMTEVPVLKLSHRAIDNLSESIVPITSNEQVNNDLEKISTAIFDMSSQLELRLTLLNFMDNEEEKSEVIEHFTNLSDIFSKKFLIVKNENNPIRSLRKRENFLHCIPFNEDILPRRWKSWFSTDMHKLFFKLDDYHQIFIPTGTEKSL